MPLHRLTCRCGATQPARYTTPEAAAVVGRHDGWDIDPGTGLSACPRCAGARK